MTSCLCRVCRPLSGPLLRTPESSLVSGSTVLIVVFEYIDFVEYQRWKYQKMC